jgi:hypothetical protein
MATAWSWSATVRVQLVMMPPVYPSTHDASMPICATGNGNSETGEWGFG